MTDRERWIVYPLLFLSIGLAMHNDIALQVAGDSSAIRCKSLEIVGPEGKPTVQITSTTEGDGLIETSDAQGNRLSRISPNAAGATLELYDRDGKTFAMVGHEANLIGLFAGDAKSGRALSVATVATHSRAPDQKPPDANESGTAPPSKSDSGAKSGAMRATKPPAQTPAAVENSQQKSAPAAK
jgi:hypothetical protein